MGMHLALSIVKQILTVKSVKCWQIFILTFLLMEIKDDLKIIFVFVLTSHLSRKQIILKILPLFN